MNKKNLIRQFVEAVYYHCTHCTDRDLPVLAHACDDYETLAECARSAAEKLSRKELQVLGNAIAGFTADNQTFNIDHRLCFRCERVAEDAVVIGNRVFCVECTCAECGKELWGVAEEQICNECETKQPPATVEGD